MRVLMISSALAALVVLSPLTAAAQSHDANVVTESGVSFLPAAAQGGTEHTLGLGGRAGGYGPGVGGMLRYWLSDTLIFDAGVAHSGYVFPGYTDFGQTVITASLLYAFRRLPYEALTLQFYVGGGVNISTWHYNHFLAGQTRETTVGGHGLVGVEMILRKVPRLGLGAEAGVYSSHRFAGIDPVGGLGSAVYAIWYVK